MKKTFLVFFMFMVLSGLLFSQSDEDLDAIMDFSLTIKEIYNAPLEKQQLYTNSEKFLVLEGSLSGVAINEGEETTINLDLVGGEWVSGGSINIYKCRIILNGSQWLRYFPADKENENAETITVHDHLLVIGKIIGYEKAPDGVHFIPVLSGRYIRAIP
jgi:hypothetical protein